MGTALLAGDALAQELAAAIAHLGQCGGEEGETEKRVRPDRLLSFRPDRLLTAVNCRAVSTRAHVG